MRANERGTMGAKRRRRMRAKIKGEQMKAKTGSKEIGRVGLWEQREGTIYVESGEASSVVLFQHRKAETDVLKDIHKSLVCFMLRLPYPSSGPDKRSTLAAARLHMRQY